MTQPPPPAGRLMAALATAVVYAVLGFAAVRLVVPPGYAAPFYPSAGIAVVAVLVGGRRMLPAVACGALIVNLTLAAQHGRVDPAAWVMAVSIGAGAALQAWAGAVLVRRFVRQPLALSEARDIALFFLLTAPVACLVNASLGTLTLGLGGFVARADLPFNWLTWWAGDALGTLVAAPVALALVGRPKSQWVPRRVTVGLPLVMVTALIVLGILQLARWDDERLRMGFESDAAIVSASLANQLLEPVHALEALRGVATVSPRLTRAQVQAAAAPWLRSGTLHAMGWSVKVARDQFSALEASARAEGYDGFRVFERADLANGSLTPPATALVVRYIEPPRGNEGALGVDSASVAVARAAIEASTTSGQPAVSKPFVLAQQGRTGPLTGVVFYQAVYDAEQPAGAAQRRAGLRGVAFVTIVLDSMLDVVLRPLPPHLHVCVVDTTVPDDPAQLGGQAGCKRGAGRFEHARAVALAGREWTVRVFADPAELPDSRRVDTWLYSGIGLIAAAMLGALLLIVSARTQRIEVAVSERTADLQAEVAERELAQGAMRESEQRFRNIFNTVPIGVVYTDLEGNVERANPQFLQLLNCTEEELRTMRAADYMHHEDFAEAAKLTGELLAGRLSTYRQHCRYLTRDGRTVLARATVSVLRDAQGEPQRIVRVMEDVTEQLRRQDAEQARDVAEAANQAKSEFLSRMSHELRTPLNAMLGFAQLLEMDRRSPLAPHQKQWIEQVQRAGWHLLEMINDVLDLSRIESGNLRLQNEPLNLSELVDAALAMIVASAEQRGILLRVELAPGTSTVLGDATRIKQILINLLSNAVKYNHEQGQIHITSRLRGADLVDIVVSDTGLGMTPDQLTDLFQPFNRLGRERSALEGTGIGLVVSLRLAELMGGSLEARSQPGEGSWFTLSLPCVIDPDTVRSDLDALAPPAARYHRRSVLYVEDNETNVEVMRGVLAQRPQIVLEVSMNGLDALAAVRQRRPDLILLDMHLPDISGLELLRHLKSNAETSDIPIVVVSADALGDQVDEAIEAGATGYVTKPVNVGELLAAVDGLLGSITSRYG
ncbi:MAG: CHASE domain-containing protein [Burkholderiaceae bacterium]